MNEPDQIIIDRRKLLAQRGPSTHESNAMKAPDYIKIESEPRLEAILQKVVKIGAKVIAHARYAVFQTAEVAVPRDLFRRILGMIDDLRPREPAPC